MKCKITMFSVRSYLGTQGRRFGAVGHCVFEACPGSRLESGFRRLHGFLDVYFTISLGLGFRV